jgi:hypothetical protein
LIISYYLYNKRFFDHFYKLALFHSFEGFGFEVALKKAGWVIFNKLKIDHFELECLVTALALAINN